MNQEGGLARPVLGVRQSSDGVPANVNLAGKTRHVAAKPPTGTSTTVTLTVPSGAYRVRRPSVTFEGVRSSGVATSMPPRSARPA
jgi:hypothetical protein